MQKVKTPTWFLVVSVVLLLWDLVGIMAFTVQMMITDEMLAAMPEAEREIYTSFPMWTKFVYFIAVVGGTLGSIGLIMKKAWSKPVFIVSLIAILIQMGYSLGATKALEVNGTGALVMPVLVIGIGIYQVILSSQSIKKGWLA